MNSPTDLRVGELVYCQFKKARVGRVVDGIVRDVDWLDGGSTGSSELICFPPSPGVELLSLVFSRYYFEVLSINNMGLNIPDIKQAFNAYWVEAVKCMETYDDFNTNPGVVKGSELNRIIVQEVQRAKMTRVFGVRIFGR